MVKHHHKLKNKHKKKLNQSKYHFLIVLVILSLFTAVYFFFRSMVSAEPFASRGLMKGKVLNRASDRILVQFKKDISDTKQQEILERQNLKEKETIRGTKVKIVNIPSGKDPVEVAANLKNSELSAIDFAEIDYQVSPEFIPNDPNFTSQWHLQKIEAPAAWDYADAFNSLIAICDSGIELNHEDLVSVLRADLGFNTVDNTTNWSPVQYHGTLVAGVAAAVVQNGLGVAGVGRNAKIIPVRISNASDGGAFVSDAAECISYAADKGAKVVNLSYRMAGSSTIDAAAAYAESKGATTIVAAGNDGIDPGWADFSTFLAVGGTDQNDARASWSNYGNFIDIVAPGESILTTSIGNQYTYASGTSLAAPLVAGTVSLLTGIKPDISPSEVKNIFYTTADDVGISGDDSTFGHGRVNVRKAVEAIRGAASPTPTSTPSIIDSIAPVVSITYPTSKTKISPNSTVEIKASASDNVGLKQVDIRVSIVTPLGNRKVTVTSLYNCIDTAAPYTCVWSVPNKSNVTYLIQALAQDLAGKNGISKFIEFTVR